MLNKRTFIRRVYKAMFAAERKVSEAITEAERDAMLDALKKACAKRKAA